MKITTRFPEPTPVPPSSFDVNMSTAELRYFKHLVGAKAPAEVNSRHGVDNTAIYQALDAACRSL